MTEKEAIRILGDTTICSPLGQAAFKVIECIKELQQCREIGTVEECREAVEKQRTKKTHIVTNELLGGTSYVCPNCGAETMLIDRNRIQWGHMQKYCGCCGQAIDKNLEGMEDE